MIKKKSIIEYAIFITIVILLILYSNYSDRKRCRTGFMELSFNGHIVSKFYDKKEHNFPILEISTVNEKIQQINLNGEYSGLFDYARKNDSIIKLSGEIKVHLFRNSIDTIFVLKARCL
jgi:hypothetical protein